MGISTSYWMPSWITERIHPWPFNQVSVVDGKKIIKCSIRGWELCCKWKDDSTSWHKLFNLKESHPLQVAEFAFAVQIADEPDFNWWGVGSLRRGTR
jgi:hypothetical protein